MDIKFEKYNLDKNILKGLQYLNYKNPSNVQQKVIPQLVNNKNIIVKSKTGSGKTASFAIPICESIDINNSNVQALVIVPTRELALQVSDEISNIGRFKKVRSSAIFGKQPIKEQIATLKQRVHVVVATPGRIIDHITRGTISLDNLKFLIIDEADKMFNKGFIEQVEVIFKNINKKTTIGLFSATIDESINSVCDTYIKKYETIEILEEYLLDKKQIDDKIIRVDENEKYNTLKNLIYTQNPDSLIIFCNTREKVSNLYNKLKKDNFLVNQIHGEISQDKRIFVINDFKKNKFNILISTDVAARGIHIDDISLVINYDITRDKENYVHRIGRTGRNNKYGKAISIVTPKDEKYLNEIQAYIGYNIEEMNINKDKILQAKSNYEEKKKQILKESRNKKIKSNDKNNEVVRIYLNIGKKKKIRVLDLVGTISSIDGIKSDDIGIIDIQDNCSYVDILNGKGKMVMKVMKEKTVKGKKLKVEIAKK